MKSPFKDRLLLLAFLLILVVFGGLLARKYVVSLSPPPERMPIAEEPRQLREILLYFSDDEGRFLVAETREIEDCLEENDCILATVRALVDGPVGDLLPILPPHTVVFDTQVDSSTATVNFSEDFITGHPGGSMSELLTVYGVTNTLAVNFPHIRQVRFLVDGQGVESIRGHVDLTRPVQTDFKFGRPPEGSSGIDAATNSETGEVLKNE